MPKYQVDVRGPGNTDVTHLTVDTDIANSSVKTSTVAANGNSTPAFNPSAENLAARKKLAEAAVNSATVRAAGSKAKSDGTLWNPNKNKAALELKRNKIASATLKATQKKQNVQKAAENTQALINVKQTALQTAIAAQNKAEQNAPSDAAAVAEAEVAAVAAMRAAIEKNWATLTIDPKFEKERTEAKQLAKMSSIE
jgi:hypothetical protein